MRILTDESTGEKFEIHPTPHGGRYVEMVAVKPEPKRIDWEKINFDVVPIKNALGHVVFRDSAENSRIGDSLITGKRIAWCGGDCPVPEGVIAECGLRDADCAASQIDATKLRWDHRSGIERRCDIIWLEVIGIAEGWTE